MMTNTQPSCVGEGELDHAPNTFEEAMGLFQAARWRTVTDKEMASLEKHGGLILV